MSEYPRVLIAASGTGGHLIPALHVARALKARDPGAVVEFIGSGRPLEKDLVEGGGFARHVIRVSGVKHRGVRGLLQFAAALPRSALQTWRLLSRFRPDAVVGAGGYVSVLPVTIAFLRRIPTWIHEAEIAPGLANRLLGYYATRVSTAFQGARMPRKGNAVFTGHPVRPELKSISAKPLDDVSVRRMLVLGGSQGAAAIDDAIAALAPELKAKGISLRHQCRAESEGALRERYRSAGIDAEVQPFIRDLATALEWADVIVSRSGAGAVMEIGVVNKPAVLVPYPFVKANHQLENARVLETAGKARIVEQGERFTERLREAIEAILEPDTYRAMRERPYAGRKLDAADEIAAGILELCGRRRKT